MSGLGYPAFHKNLERIKPMIDKSGIPFRIVSEDRFRRVIIEAFKTETLRDLTNNPPIRFGFAGFVP